MAGVAIKKKPDRKVTSLKVTRPSAATWQASWKVPAAAMKETNVARFEGVNVKWFIDLRGSSDNPVDLDHYNTVAEEMTNGQALTEYVGTAAMGAEWKDNALSRSAFYPLTSFRINKIRAKVCGTNSKGNGEVVSFDYVFDTPRKPTVSGSYDEETGVATFVIKTNAGLDKRERYDTRWRITAEISGCKNAVVVKDWAASTSVDFSYSYDISNLGITTFSTGTILNLKAEAYARGIRGNSETSTATLTIAYPRVPVIKSVSGWKHASGKVAVVVELGTHTSAVQLQRLKGASSDATASSVASGAWENVDGASDNGKCSALYDAAADAVSNAGYYTWYRLKVSNCGWSRYGAPVRADCLFTAAPTAENDRCGLVSVTAGEDGKSAKAVVGYTEDTSNTGTEIAWSTDPNAWESNSQPSSFRFSWEDETRQSVTWEKTATVYLAGLETGETYYVRARRYLESDSGTTYTAWSAHKAVTPTAAPESVTLSAPAFVARGEGIPLSWEVSGDAAQTAYAVHPAGSPKVSYARGTDSLGYATVPAARYGSADSVSLYVSVATGGSYTDSNTVDIGIADAPSCSVSAASTLTAQPASFSVVCNNPSCDLLCTVSSLGVTREMPDGDRDQLAGDVVWTDGVSPAWSADGSAYTATVTLPDGIAFVDGGEYDVSVTAIDPQTGLSSDAAAAKFAVAWAHQAHDPSCSVEADGAGRKATILLVEPVGAAATDVYDLYRKTPDGCELIAEGLPLACAVIDLYAPYGSDPELAYRACVRTIDGDVSFDDFAYEMPVDVMRIDFGDDFVELPYNIVASDSYAKQFEARRHADGTISGYWEAGVQKTGSLSAVVPRDGDPAIHEALRRLARHAGSAFCRTPKGHAFECNCTVNVSSSYASPTSAVSLNVTAVALTDAYRVRQEDVEEAGA